MGSKKRATKPFILKLKGKRVKQTRGIDKKPDGDYPLPWEEEDKVNHPKHYNIGRIEVIEAIEDWQLDYHRGNAVKYIARAGIKDPSKEIEDLKKAIWYINRRVELLTSRKENRETKRPNDTSIGA